MKLSSHYKPENPKFISNFGNNHVSGEVICLTPNRFLIRGKVHGVSGQSLPVSYRAANPADTHLSVSGSALPFANVGIAFNPTVNSGLVKTDNSGQFEFSIHRPNSYYSCNGRQLIPPHLNLLVANQKFYVALGPGYQSRSLTGLPGRPNRTYRR